MIKGRNLLCEVNVKDIAFINAIFEWYHEIGTVRTRDKKKGLIEIWLSPNFFEEGLKVVNYLKNGKFVEKIEVLEEIGDNWHKK